MSLGFLLGLLNVVSAYALREAERPVQDGFNFYWNALWCSVITITTVGYGDLYPISHPGRVVAVAASILGTGIFAILIADVFEAIKFNHSEFRMQRMLHKSRLRRELKNAASRLITGVIRLKITRKKMKQTQELSSKAPGTSPGELPRRLAASAKSIAVAKSFQWTVLHRSVRTFREVSQQVRASTRNIDADPTHHISAAIGSLQDRAQKHDIELAAWQSTIDQRFEGVDQRLNGVDQRLESIQESLVELLKRTAGSGPSSSR
jgi:hypothetical protein